MEYSIKQLSKIAGVSARTLRYYEEIGLLKPLYTNEAGYRFYGDNEVALLQQILFYKGRGLDLKQIRGIIYDESFDIITALEDHLLKLEEQKEHTELLIRTVKKTISSMRGECEMNDKEKFEAFKDGIIEENEKKYGEEVRGKYGGDEVEGFNSRIKGMSQQDWDRFKDLEMEVKGLLEKGIKESVKSDSLVGKEITTKHREWISMVWKTYTPQAHKGVAMMYLADQRFKAYYDSKVEGCAKLLADSINCWA
ncbi:MAG: MerR family transcriptional regulator [Clostridiales bacterium]|nr:MerR family transcriptional regulator [Clostridiales bacterium]